MPIKNIVAGQKVWSYDMITGKKVLSSVVKTMTSATKRLYQVFVGKDTLKATEKHPFYANLQWTAAKDVRKGASILLLSGMFGIVDSVATIDTLATTYNFEVEQTHNYFVGTEGVLVHNDCNESISIIRNILGNDKTKWFKFLKRVYNDYPLSTRIKLYEETAKILDAASLNRFFDDFEGIEIFRQAVVLEPKLLHLPFVVRGDIKWLRAGKSWIDEGITFVATSTQTILSEGSTHIGEIKNGKLLPIIYDSWRSPSNDVVGEVINGYQVVKVGSDYKVKRVADRSPYSSSEITELTQHSDAHVLDRHGADVTDDALIKRANTNPAIAPDGSTSGSPPYSSKFESPAKLKEALAQTRPGTPAFLAKTPNRFPNGYDVNYELTDGTFFGYGIARNTTSRTYFKKVLASYSEVSPGNFQLVTMYLIP